MDIFEMPVHPAAAVFPMLEEDELNQLAEDIRENGLIHPLVVKGDELIDGRNRREACRRAGVTPAVTELNGVDPELYILQTNIARRHLTKSQAAMAVAIIYPEVERGRGKKDPAQKPPKFGGIPQQRLNEARTVLKASRGKAEKVLGGTLTLWKALAEIEQEEYKAGEPARRLAALRQRYPDLADGVEAGELTQPDAERQADARDEKERQRRVGVKQAFETFQRFALILHGENFVDLLELCRRYPREFDIDQVKTLIAGLAADLRVAEQLLSAQVHPPLNGTAVARQQ